MPEDPTVKFPNVNCKMHVPAPGYLICVHVIKGEPAHYLHFRQPTSTHLGVILCPKPQLEHHNAQLALCCAACALVKGYLPDAAIMTMKSPNAASGGKL